MSCTLWTSLFDQVSENRHQKRFYSQDHQEDTSCSENGQGPNKPHPTISSAKLYILRVPLLRPNYCNNHFLWALLKPPNLLSEFLIFASENTAWQHAFARGSFKVYKRLDSSHSTTSSHDEDLAFRSVPLGLRSSCSFNSSGGEFWTRKFERNSGEGEWRRRKQRTRAPSGPQCEGWWRSKTLFSDQRKEEKEEKIQTTPLLQKEEL